MILTKTVLVLGAGASMHLKFPLGRKLKEDVCHAFIENEGVQLAEVLRDAGRTPDELKDFARALRASHQPSIDLFVEPEARSHFRPPAREAIAAALVPFETDAYLQTSSGWYEYLFNSIGSRLDHFEQSLLSIVTFNYERSLDWFFLTFNA